MSTYQINFYNNSSLDFDFCCYQQDENLNVNNAMSLAWFTTKCDANTMDFFKWNIDYCFVWSQTGILKSGIQFQAAEKITADPDTANHVRLDNDGAFKFTQLPNVANSGGLYIDQSASVPPNQASVGIGMSGAGTFVVQANPNLNLLFTPKPSYFVACGTFIEGQVMDIQTMTTGQEVHFPPGVYVMHAILNEDNKWTISQTAPAKSFKSNRAALTT